MKKHIGIFLFVATMLIWRGNVFAGDVVVIKSSDVKPYEDTLAGFRSVCKAGIREFTLSEENDDKIRNEIRKTRPDLIFAVGMTALLRARQISDIPVIYAMVSNPGSVLSGSSNVTGVSMNISARQQLDTLLNLFPGIRKIGIIYDPEKTGNLYRDARSAADAAGVSLVHRPVEQSREVPSAINDMKGGIDAFWLLPDSTVITRESLEYLLLFSFENRVPILSFSDKYIEMGSLLALNIDAGDIGRQAGEMANMVLDGSDVAAVPAAPPRKSLISLNLKVAEKMGIKIDRKSVDGAVKVY
jgi:putative ABC transport system substrate-binding protein